jgi:hypothetical protein
MVDKDDLLPDPYTPKAASRECPRSRTVVEEDELVDEGLAVAEGEADPHLVPSESIEVDGHVAAELCSASASRRHSSSSPGMPKRSQLEL